MRALLLVAEPDAPALRKKPDGLQSAGRLGRKCPIRRSESRHISICSIVVIGSAFQRV